MNTCKRSFTAWGEMEAWFSKIASRKLERTSYVCVPGSRTYARSTSARIQATRLQWNMHLEKQRVLALIFTDHRGSFSSQLGEYGFSLPCITQKRASALRNEQSRDAGNGIREYVFCANPATSCDNLAYLVLFKCGLAQLNRARR
ncbi:uncharacterized protein ZBAI_05998 [Zygosaccharomyces bailii ISA1307]|nr:uncharacterized protein ZBAI_05998 [Zygosaccharomyces bailii ISA1307]